MVDCILSPDIGAAVSTEYMVSDCYIEVINECTLRLEPQGKYLSHTGTCYMFVQFTVPERAQPPFPSEHEVLTFIHRILLNAHWVPYYNYRSADVIKPRLQKVSSSLDVTPMLDVCPLHLCGSLFSDN